MGLNKGMTAYIQYYNITHTHAHTALKTLCALSLFNPPPPITGGNH